MNHLEKAFVDDTIFARYGKLAICLIIFLGTLLFHLMVGFGAMAIVYYIITGSLKGVLLDAYGILILQDKNIILATLVVPFTFALLFLIFLVRLYNKRSFSEMVNGTKSIRWHRIGFSFALWFGIMSIYTIIAYFIAPSEFTLQFDLSKFILLFLISILFIPLQTTFEEILLRGYLAQEVAMLTRSRWLALLIPALAFAMMHIANPEIEKYGMGVMLSTYFAMAFIWGLTTILDDGIEISMGMHAANNIFISLFTTQRGAAFETDAVFEITHSDPHIALAELVGMGFLVILICYKKYNWSFATLNKKIENPEKPSPSVS